MKFYVKTGLLEQQKSDCFIVGLFENELGPTAKRLDKISRGYISEFLKQKEFLGKVGETLLLYQVPHIKAKRILLVGCGKSSILSAFHFRKMILNSYKMLSQSKVKDVISFLPEIPVEKQLLPATIKQNILVGFDAFYQFTEFKSKKTPPFSLETVTLVLPDKNQIRECEIAVKEAQVTAAGVNFTKNLANRPSNICTPTYLANEAKKLSKQYSSLKTTILDVKQMKKLGMNAFLAVAKGSSEPPQFICLEYKGGNKKQSPIALVGKGITFDTGGISLKPSDSMLGMKYDMCGAATVLGVLKSVAELKLPLNVVGIIPTAENMPSGNALKPEDILTSLSGQTIEVLNTDAEGRLILCDALTYCERYKPNTVIDIATLTGAVVIALGHHATGLISNYQPLADDLLQAGTETYDRAWQLPLWDEYQEQIKSTIADMANIGGRSAGSITAACFLSNYAKKFHWAHLDVAGTAAMMGGPERYATGRPVPLLMQFLINRCNK